jgi:hypothetical protein
LSREFNELEYLSYAVGQPFNIAVMLQLEGSISIELLKKTLEKLQKRHPLLKVRIEYNDRGRPSFTSEGVESIPITKLTRESNTLSVRIFHKQLSTPFNLDSITLPLMRVIVLESPKKTDLILCALHSISDGQSMIYLVRDLINYMVDPNEPVETLDLPIRDVDLLTKKVRKMIPKRLFFSRLARFLFQSYNFFRYTLVGKRKTAEINIQEDQLEIYSWKLTAEQTTAFLKKCKEVNVRVQSAVSTAYTPEFPVIGGPVNLRQRLNQQIGEVFGFYTGLAIYQKKYRKNRTFWENAKKVQKKLYKGLQDKRLFFLYKLFPKNAPLRLLRKTATYFIEVVTNKEPFSLDNLGPLDRYFETLDLSKFPVVSSFYGGITSFLDTFIVLFFTLRGEMHFYHHYTTTKFTLEEVKQQAEKARTRLLNALKN